jgi:hypothetical protein
LKNPPVWLFRTIVLLLIVIFCNFVVASSNTVDLSRAVVRLPPTLKKTEMKAVAMFLDEVEKRTNIRLETVSETSSIKSPTISLKVNQTNKITLPAEGYRIETQSSSITITGNDGRGLLFGIGYLLRHLVMKRGSLMLPEPLDITSAPKFKLRGHQLGYRPKTNSYDAWTLPMWEQYVRDLVVFGTNAIELIPPRSDDDSESPHFPRPIIETIKGISRIADEYGLDVWIWYPALDKNYADPKTVDFAIKEWGEVFKALPRLDAIFVPGGDPGSTPPDLLMSLLEKQKINARRYHPNCNMWMAPQSFSVDWMKEWFNIINQLDTSKWLDGIVYGPEVRIPMAQFREMLPKSYRFRHYPDITHTRQSQFPVPDWDPAYSVSEGREPINPRPVDMATIFRSQLKAGDDGFISYSEGCNDDVNKIIWSALGWNPDADPLQVLREFSNYFIGPAYTDDFAQGLLALERNWRGPLMANEKVYDTLQMFQTLERESSPHTLLNWRFQQALYRAYFDAYTRARLLYEKSLEDLAIEKLRQSDRLTSELAIREAEAILDRGSIHKTATDWRQRIISLGEALYQSIHMQLDEQLYKAVRVARGANLATLDYPLNNIIWLKGQFSVIRQLTDERERLQKIRGLVEWTNPGPGGFYDDLGDPQNQPHLVKVRWEDDPSYLISAFSGVAIEIGYSAKPLRVNHLEPELTRIGFVPPGRFSWLTDAQTHFDAPLQMSYQGLDPNAQYRVRAVYGGDIPSALIKLTADDSFTIHPLMEKKYKMVEFDIPRQATADGKLTLSWTQAPGSRGNGRGTQVAEVWLIKART